jgi:acyl-CoA thioester hydrolase
MNIEQDQAKKEYYDFQDTILRHTTEIRVRYSDTDKMGFVYNGNYLAFFEIGRTETMRHHGLPYTVFEKEGFFLPVVEAYVKYKSPSYYDDILKIGTIMKPELKATVRFDYNILRGDTTIAEGFTIHTFMNSISRKPVRPPKFYLDIMAGVKKSV